MAQFDFGNLSSPLSGADFIDDNLEPWRDALHSSHSGISAPSYIVGGMVWVNTSATPWTVGMYDGGQTVSMGTVNATTHVFKPNLSGLAGDVTNAMLASMAANTVKLNNTASSAAAVDLSMGSSTILARLATGNIVAASTTQIKSLLGISFTDISGTAGVAQGGTGLTSFTAGDLMYATGATTLTKLGMGTALQSLRVNSSAAALEWGSAGGLGGASITTSATSITLTSGSNKVQDIAMTTDDLHVQLPDATGMSTGGDAFIISNTGTYPYVIKDNGGNIVSMLGPGQCASIAVSSISSSNGIWRPRLAASAGVTTVASVHTSGASQTATSNALYSNFLALSASTGILFFSNGTSIQAAFCTISAQGISAGSPVTIATETTAQVTGIQSCILASGSVLVSWYKSSATTALRACCLSISGTAITPGTAVTVDSTGSPAPVSLFSVSSTSAIVFYATSAGQTKAMVLSAISTSGMTTNTAVSIGASSAAAGYHASAAQLSATNYLVVYAGASSFGCMANVTVSGTTVTANTSVVNIVSGSAILAPKMVAISSTQALFVVNLAGPACYAGVITCPSTTPAISSIFVEVVSGASVEGVAFVNGNCYITYPDLNSVPGNRVYHDLHPLMVDKGNFAPSFSLFQNMPAKTVAPWFNTPSTQSGANVPVSGINNLVVLGNTSSAARAVTLGMVTNNNTISVAVTDFNLR